MSERTIRVSKRRCENCDHATFIDSGYMNCQRWSPEPDDPRDGGYPTNPVPWDYRCGEFLHKHVDLRTTHEEPNDG